MPPTATAETVFPAVPESVGSARRFTRAALGRHDVEPHVIDTAMLLVSELATNAIVHAESTVRLRIDVGDEIRVEVRDEDSTPLAPETPGLDAESGRGLTILTNLASEWSWTTRSNGKVVWFSLARD